MDKPGIICGSIIIRWSQYQQFTKYGNKINDKIVDIKKWIKFEFKH